MSNVDSIINNVINLNQTDILVKVLNKQEVQDFIIFLNTEKQLRLGLTSENKIIGFYQSDAYSALKDRQSGRKAPSGVVDLHLEGDYYRTFVVQVLNNGDFIIDSNPLKGGVNLMDKYGNKLEGLTPANLEALVDFITLLYVKETRKAIFK